MNNSEFLKNLIIDFTEMRRIEMMIQKEIEDRGRREIESKKLGGQS